MHIKLDFREQNKVFGRETCTQLQGILYAPL